MGKFSTIPVTEAQLEGDNGVRVSRMLSLIAGSQYEGDIREYLSVARHENEIISIKGASTLVSRIEEIKTKFTKFDVLTVFDKVTFPIVPEGTNEESDTVFQLTFDGEKSIQYPDFVEQEIQDEIAADESIQAEPIYDALRQVFSKLFRFEPYAMKLLEVPENLRVNIVDANLKMLKGYYSGKNLSHRYRMLRENETGKYYFRALISPRRYQDYNVGVSVFIALLSMHQAMQRYQSNYIIRNFSYTESKVSVLFENTRGERIDNVGEVRFQVLLTNSETTKGAVKLSGMYTIVVEVDGRRIYLEAKQPEEGKAFKDTILSISHGSGPEKAIKKMAANEALRTVETRLYEEIRRIRTSRDADALKVLFKSRLDSSRSLIGSDASRAEINTLFNDQVNTFNDLLKIMGKTQMIMEADGMESKDSLKYIVHTVLFGTRGRNQGQDDEDEDDSDSDDEQ